MKTQGRHRKQRPLRAPIGDRIYEVVLTVSAVLSLVATVVLLALLKLGSFADQCSVLVGTLANDFCRRHHESALALTPLTPFVTFVCILGIVAIKRSPRSEI